MRNRQWVSIALWTAHHDIHVKGNKNSDKGNLDGDYTTYTSCGTGYTNSNGEYIVTGNTIPDTWNHNGLSTGIHNMVGNVWEWVDGLEGRSGSIYIHDEDGIFIDSGIIISNTNNTGSQIISIFNTSDDILNEGIPNIINNNGYIPSNLDTSHIWFNPSISQGTIVRGGKSAILMSHIWTLYEHNSIDFYGAGTGFRIIKQV